METLHISEPTACSFATAQAPCGCRNSRRSLHRHRRPSSRLRLRNARESSRRLARPHRERQPRRSSRATCSGHSAGRIIGAKISLARHFVAEQRGRLSTGTSLSIFPLSLWEKNRGRGRQICYRFALTLTLSQAERGLRRITAGSFASMTRIGRLNDWARLAAAAIHRHGDRRDRQRRQEHYAANDPCRAAIAAPRHGQPSKFQQPFRRPVEHDGHRAGRRLRRARIGRKRAGRNRRHGRVVSAAGRSHHLHRRRPSRRLRQPRANRPGQGRAAGGPAGRRSRRAGRRPLAAAIASKSAADITWVGVGEDCDLRAKDIRNVERPIGVPRRRLPVLVARLRPPSRDGSASSGGRRTNDGF